MMKYFETRGTQDMSVEMIKKFRMTKGPNIFISLPDHPSFPAETDSVTHFPVLLLPPMFRDGDFQQEIDKDEE